MIELLKEARDVLWMVQTYIPSVEQMEAHTHDGLAVADVDACQKLADRIDAALAKPAPDAMEIVDKIREYYIHHPEAYDDYAVANFTMPVTEAAALIEAYSHTMSPKLFDEILQSQPLSIAKLGRLLVKHGYKVEECR